MFSIVSNDPDYDNLSNVIEFVEGIDDFNFMEKTVDDFLMKGLIPSNVPKVQGFINIDDQGNTTLESYVILEEPEVVSFEFGVSLGEIEFVQNYEFDELTEEECEEILTKLMSTGLFEIEEKTFGVVYWLVGTENYKVNVRPYIDGWDWDFDHPDTKEIDISL